MVVELDTGLTATQANSFRKWFDKNIGTEYEYEVGDDNLKHFVLFDLEYEEFIQVQKWETDNT